MRLYIATTTLNFDSIMSTESFSPHAFYSMRGFGISLFYQKASFALENSILLVDAVPIFKIDDPDVEHHPMVIEIDDSNYPGAFEMVKENDRFSVYRATRTIYLSPLSCRILFVNSRDMNMTLTRADSIIEAKYKLYHKMGAISTIGVNDEVVNLNRSSFDNIKDIAEPDSKAIAYDIRVNKAKGFVFSYMMGAGKALTPDSVRMLRLVKEIKNAIYSIGTKDGRQESAMNALDALVKQAEELSVCLDNSKIEANGRVDSFLERTRASEMLRGSSKEEIIAWLKFAHLYAELYRQLNSGLRIFDISSCVSAAMNSDDEKKSEQALDMLQRYTNSILKSESVSVSATDLFAFEGELNVIDIKDSAIADESKEKLKTLYNLYSDFGYGSTDVRNRRIDYIVDAGVALGMKETDNQREKDYFNALLDNLEHAEKFDILNVDSSALQSLAAFMKAPDKDIDKMVSLLVNSEISDGRIAYGLWGIFYGYSAIPQTYYNEFIRKYSERDAASELVRQCYSLIFRSEPLFPAPEARKVREKPEKNWIGRTAEKVMNYLSPKEESVPLELELDFNSGDMSGEDMPDFTGSAKESVVSEPPVTFSENIGNMEDLPSEYAVLSGQLCEIIKENAPKSDKAKFIRYYSDEVSNLCATSENLISIINGLDRITVEYGKTAWNTSAKPALKKFLKQLEKAESERRAEQARLQKQAEREAQRRRAEEEYQIRMREHEQARERMFASGYQKSLYNDIDAWFLIESVLPQNDREVINQVRTDFEWFQKNYEPTYYDKRKGPQPGRYYEYPKDNVSVINNYEGYLRRKKDLNPNASWIAPIYSRVNIEPIITVLKAVYR